MPKRGREQQRLTEVLMPAGPPVSHRSVSLLCGRPKHSSHSTLCKSTNYGMAAASEAALTQFQP